MELLRSDTDQAYPSTMFSLWYTAIQGTSLTRRLTLLKNFVQQKWLCPSNSFLAVFLKVFSCIEHGGWHGNLLKKKF